MKRTKKYNLLFADSEVLSDQARSLLKDFFTLRECNPNQDEIVDEAKNADYLWVRLKYLFNKETLNQLSHLKALATNTTGISHIDTKSAKGNNIDIIKLDPSSSEMKLVTSAAEHAVALMFSLIRNIPRANKHALAGKWERNKFTGHQLSDMTVGIVGYGRVGKQISKILSPIAKEISFYDIQKDIKKPSFAKFLDINHLLNKSDVIFICISESEENEYFFNSQMTQELLRKPYIINISRGSIIDIKLYFDLLLLKKIRGLGIDVIEGEERLDFSTLDEIRKKVKDHNFIVTPHIGGNTFESWVKTELIIANALIEHAQQ